MVMPCSLSNFTNILLNGLVFTRLFFALPKILEQIKKWKSSIQIPFITFANTWKLKRKTYEP